jgi:hypothetical protein
MASLGRCGNLLMHNIARDGRNSFSSGLGVQGCFGNTAASDFYDLTIFSELWNLAQLNFTGGNAIRLAVLFVGYSFRSDVIFAKRYKITNITL